MTQNISTSKRRLEGTITSVKMAKTIVVSVHRTRIHKRYGKRYQVTKKYKVHDELGGFAIGDRVRFEECRPLSKEKRWRVIEKLS